MRTITLRPLRAIGVPLEAEKISPDVFAPLSLSQIRSLEAFQGNRKTKIADHFKVEGDEAVALVDETTIRLEGDFSRVKRIGENMNAGTVEILGSVGMRAGSGMKGGIIRVDGDADDWLGREMRGGKILVSGNAGNYVGSGYRGEKCGMRGGEIEIGKSAGAYLGEHMCGGTIRVSGNAGDFPGAANQGGTIVIGGSTFLPGAEMAKGTITVRGKAAVLPSYKKAEVAQIEGLDYQKYIGDLVENGKGELYVALG
ncbi:MAG TPA: formylmethanofuran dehydrogenase subunit C [Methanotrichaceae archaeon]|nr:formylmethanofuran dehydrogenase subunit C [Methanotrichaceae archaeon]